MSAYIQATKEKVFPITVALVLIATGIGVFLLFDAVSGFTLSSSSLISRIRATTYYWVFYKYPQSDVSAYAQATSTIPAKSIPVLLYHGESASKGNTPVSLFVDQMRALKKNGWRTIAMTEFHDFMKNGKQLPDKSFLLTFDDGRRDTFYPFDPILDDMGFHSVMFVVTGFSMPDKGKPADFYLTKKELDFMLETGRWELQSHGHRDHFKYNVQSTTDLSQDAQTVQGNFLSNKFWNDAANRFETDEEFATRIRTDLIEARQRLEKTFGHTVHSFAYPFNDFGESTVNFSGSTEIIARVVPSIYTFAFYQHWSANGDSFNYPDKDVFAIKRIEPPLNWDGQDLMRALEAGYAKPLPYTSARIGDEWVGIWGDIEKENGTITLAARSDSTGSSGFLNGSGWWRDYEFTASVVWIAGENVALIARNTDDTRNVACSVLRNGVAVDEQRGEEVIRLAFVPRTTLHGPLLLGMRVEGQSVQCFVDGSAVVSAAFNDLSTGGIGVKVWDARFGVAKSTFADLSVRALP